MTKLRKIMLSSVACATLLLSGCGSSGGSSTPPGDDTTSGTVSGSYYKGAIVCFDTDGNGNCDGEATDTTDKYGNYTLSGSGNYPIIAEIPVGAKKYETKADADADNGIEINASTQTVFAIPQIAIAKAKAQGGKVVLSTISTKLYSYVKENNSTDITTAMNAVASILGLDKDDLLKDFNSASISASTKTLLREKASTLLENIKGHADLNATIAAAKSFVAAMTTPEPIDVVKAK